MQALKESKKTGRRQLGTGGSSEGTGRIPGVLDVSTIISNTSSEGIGTKPGVPNEEKVTSEEKVILEWGSEQESNYSKKDQGDDEEVDWIDFSDDDEKKDDDDDDKSIDLEMTDDEETEDEFIQGDTERSDVAKADVEKTEEVKDDAKKAELPPTTPAYLYLQSPSILRVPVSVISKPLILTPVQETPSAKYLTQKHSVKPAPKSSKIKTPTIDLEQESEKSASKILKVKKEQAEKQKMPKYTIKSTDKATLKDYDQKSALYQTMHKNKSFNINPANHRLYHALMEALIEDENSIDKGVANTGKKIKRRRTKESESSKKPSTTKETSKRKALSKGSKIGKSVTAKEPIEEPIAEVEMDDLVNTTAEDVALDADQPHDDSTQAKDTALKQDWFKQPPRPPTLDLE
ncbi:hypothetical protein Tco_0510669 [Tanacetum coccineum]